MSLRIIDFFGLPVTFRVEALKNAVAVVLSLRSRDKARIDGNGAIVYEHPPAYRTLHGRGFRGKARTGTDSRMP